jgi:hypothetical protein
MAKHLHDKFFYKKHFRYFALDIPSEIETELCFVPEMRTYNPEDAVFLLVFLNKEEELRKFIAKISPFADKPVLWIAYPKKNSSVQTDISRDLAWDIIREAGFDGVSLISVNQDWTGVRLKKLSVERNRDYKPISKQGIRVGEVPTAFKTALLEHGSWEKFQEIPFSQQKIYIDSFNRAVKNETKVKRIDEILHFLEPDLQNS